MRVFAIALSLILAAASPLSAHPLHGAASLAAGLAHPLLGLDHLLAMTAVGLWAAVAGGRALWLWPALFVSTMVGGYALGAGGIVLPLVEPAILASVVVLGLLLATAARLPVAAGAALVAAFALCHGDAHGAEAPAAAALAYVLGFAATTAGLHLAGLALGRALRAARAPRLVRAAGATIALAGLLLA